MTAGKHKKIVTILLILTLCFIWGNSLMPATVSGDGISSRDMVGEF